MLDKAEQIKDSWFAVVNPNAGSGKTRSQWKEAEALLKGKGIKFDVVVSETTSDSRELITNACRKGYRRFIAVGGDGTVHNLMGTIAEFTEKSAAEYTQKISLSDFYLAVLPIGSGNDWLHSHNIPVDYKIITNLMATSSFGRQDVVRVDIYSRQTGKISSTDYIANIGGYCFDANVCDVVNEQKRKGMTSKLIYFNAVKKEATSQKAFRTKILCDGEPVFDDLLYTMSVGNGKFSGGGICQTPDAVMDDGMIDIMIAPKFPVLKILLSLRKVISNRIDEIRFLKFFRAKEIFIEPEGQGQLVEADGDIIGRAPAKFSILPEQINVLHKFD